MRLAALQVRRFSQAFLSVNIPIDIHRHTGLGINPARAFEADRNLQELDILNNAMKFKFTCP